MYQLQVWIAVLAVLSQVSCLPSSRRVARQSNSFMVISNQSASCESFSPSLPRFSLTNRDKMEVFQSQGGHLIPSLMAMSSEEARESFSNLLPLPPEVKDNLQNFSPTRARSFLKQTLSDFLHQNKDKTSTLDQDAINSNREHDTIDNENNTHEEKDITDNNKKANEEYNTKDKKKSTQNVTPQSKSPPHHRRWQRQRRDAANVEETQLGQQIDGSGEELKNAKDSVLDGGAEFKNAKKNEVLTKVVPVEDTPFADIQKTASGTSRLESCVLRASPTATDSSFLYMCTACSATTERGEDTFPRIINEVTCAVGDDGCLYVEGLAHGKCQQVYMPINGLVRQPGLCVLALKDGQTVVAEEWVVETQMLRVGCECAVHRDSFFAQFL